MEFVKRLNRFRFFQHSYRNPSEFYDSLIVFPNMVAKITGMDIFSEGYRVISWSLFSVVVLLTVYVYTSVVTASEVWGSTEDLIFCFVTAGIGLQGLGKLYTFVAWMHQYNKELFRKECNPTVRKMLMDSVFLLSVIVKTMLVCYVSTSILLDVAPLLFSIQTGEKILPFGFYIPFLDRNEWFGYFCNYAMHVCNTVYVSSEDMGPDCIYMIMMMCAFTQIDLLKESLTEFNQKIEENEDDLDAFFGEIIRHHRDHLEYLQTIEKVFQLNFLITFVSLSTVLVMSLFAVVTLSWYQGYVFVAFISYELFFGSFLGTMLEIKKEQLQQAIYAISWYKLSSENQKSLRFMLHASQESVSLTLIFAPLNMPTFLQVYKTIYSIFTMLLTVREE
ncbi:conserved hypothetical protein [Culex quinquefasciatus]|uniref:Odorant receptor n=1 Tax=Culex quinquefasciatus TaxID=7176 RepID=B0W318_CULQU|nr:conserved hypothetical protein [Culex quinquefasciatus]|eukprot:XP_001843102.1 conserved hypothetical protein [Culex quinquefasciatus]